MFRKGNGLHQCNKVKVHLYLNSSLFFWHLFCLYSISLDITDSFAYLIVYAWVVRVESPSGFMSFKGHIK